MRYRIETVENVDDVFLNLRANADQSSQIIRIGLKINTASSVRSCVFEFFTFFSKRAFNSNRNVSTVYAKGIYSPTEKQFVNNATTHNYNKAKFEHLSQLFG